jgi:hypothetical protein
MVDKITKSASGGMVFEGSGIEVFRLLAIAQALDLYGRTGIKANTAYTPTAMLRNATEATGKRYKRGAYFEAAADLRKVVNDLRAKIEFVTE